MTPDRYRRACWRDDHLFPYPLPPLRGIFFSFWSNHRKTAVAVRDFTQPRKEFKRPAASRRGRTSWSNDSTTTRARACSSTQKVTQLRRGWLGDFLRGGGTAGWCCAAAAASPKSNKRLAQSSAYYAPNVVSLNLTARGGHACIVSFFWGEWIDAR